MTGYAFKIGRFWGNMVIEPKFTEVDDFEDGITEVWIDDKMGYIDRKGNYIWKPTS
jgi:hypothetical protein